MAEPYRFQYTPPEEDYDLERLKASLMQNVQATQGLEALTPKLESARGMREHEIEVDAGVGPWGALLQAMADATRTSRGTADLRTLEPQEDALRADIAEGEGQEKLFDLYNARQQEQRAAEDQQRELESFNVNERRAITGEERAVAGEERSVTKEERDAAAERRTVEQSIWDISQRDKLDPKEITAFQNLKDENDITYAIWDPKKEKYVHADDRSKEFNTAGYVEYDTDDDTRGKALGYRDITHMAEDASLANNVAYVADSYDPNFAQVGTVPTLFGNKLLQKLGMSDIMKYADDEGKMAELDQDAKNAVRWWANWNMTYTLPNRHKWFGGTLTNNEQKAWQAAEAMHPGMDPKEIQKRIDELTYWVQKRQEIKMNSLLKDPYKPNRPAYIETGQAAGLNYNPETDRFEVADQFSINDIKQGRPGASAQQQGPEITEIAGVPPEITANMSQKALKMLATKSPEWIAEKFPQSVLPQATGGAR